MSPQLRVELLQRLSRSEDPWVERKQSFDEREVRKTLVGFANSLREGETAVLFLGARNDGKHPGLSDADDVQKKVGGVASEKCYPRISYNTAVLEVDINGKKVEILAVVVPFSANRPHFGGVAYIRQGSETKEASAEVFLELIASQNDKARRILKFKGTRVTVHWRSQSGLFLRVEGILEFCDAHSFTFRDDVGCDWSSSLSEVEIKKDSMHPLIIVSKAPWTESELVRRMVRQWRWTQRPESKGIHPINRNDYIAAQLLANPALSEPAIASEMDGTADRALKSLLVHVRFELKKIRSPLSELKKRKHLDLQFNKLMRGQHPSGTPLIAAVVHPVAEVATSLDEAKHLIQYLGQSNAAVSTVPTEAYWNALMWELGFA